MTRPARTTAPAASSTSTASHAQAVNDKLVVQAVGRVLHAGRAAAPDRHDTEFVQHAVSAVHEQRDVAAEVRRPRRLRRWRMRGKLVVHRRRRRHRGHHSQRHRPVRHRQRIATDATSAVATRRAARHVAFFTNLLNGDAVEPAVARYHRGAAAARRSTPRPSTSKRPISAPSARGTSSATVATSATTASTSRSRPNGDNRNEGGAYVQDEIFLSRPRSAGWSAARVDKFSSIDNAVFSPRTTLMSSRSLQSDVPASRSTARSARHRSSTTTSIRRC